MSTYKEKREKYPTRVSKQKDDYAYLTHTDDSEVIWPLDGIYELAVQLVGTKRVGKLPKVHFEERRNGMNILPDSFVLNQSWNAVLVKSIPMEKKKKKKSIK